VDADGIVSIDLVISGGETFSVCLSNVSDRFIDLVIEILSINGDAELSVFFSNVSDRVMDVEEFSVLIGILDLIGVIFNCSLVEILSFVGGKLLRKQVLG